jgi:hypothetical protein
MLRYNGSVEFLKETTSLSVSWTLGSRAGEILFADAY